LLYALNKLILISKDSYKGISPELEFLNYHDKFIISYRRTGEDTNLQVAKIFRKTAHRVYRIMLKKNMTNSNVKFLNLV